MKANNNEQIIAVKPKSTKRETGYTHLWVSCHNVIFEFDQPTRSAKVSLFFEIPSTDRRAHTMRKCTQGASGQSLIGLWLHTNKRRHTYTHLIVLLLEIWCWCIKAEKTASSYEPSSSISEQSLASHTTAGHEQGAKTIILPKGCTRAKSAYP